MNWTRTGRIDWLRGKLADHDIEVKRIEDAHSKAIEAHRQTLERFADRYSGWMKELARLEETERDMQSRAADRRTLAKLREDRKKARRAMNMEVAGLVARDEPAVSVAEARQAAHDAAYKVVERRLASLTEAQRDQFAFELKARFVELEDEGVFNDGMALPRIAQTSPVDLLDGIISA